MTGNSRLFGIIHHKINFFHTLKFVISKFFPIHLPLFVLLNCPHRLSHGITLPMLMKRMGCLMLMKYNAVPFLRILWIMNIPSQQGLSHQ